MSNKRPVAPQHDAHDALNVELCTEDPINQILVLSAAQPSNRAQKKHRLECFVDGLGTRIRTGTSCSPSGKNHKTQASSAPVSSHPRSNCSTGSANRNRKGQNTRGKGKEPERPGGDQQVSQQLPSSDEAEVCPIVQKAEQRQKEKLEGKKEGNDKPGIPEECRNLNEPVSLHSEKMHYRCPICHHDPKKPQPRSKGGKNARMAFEIGLKDKYFATLKYLIQHIKTNHIFIPCFYANCKERFSKLEDAQAHEKQKSVHHSGQRRSILLSREPVRQLIKDYHAVKDNVDRQIFNAEMEAALLFTSPNGEKKKKYDLVDNTDRLPKDDGNPESSASGFVSTIADLNDFSTDPGVYEYFEEQLGQAYSQHPELDGCGPAWQQTLLAIFLKVYNKGKRAGKEETYSSLPSTASNSSGYYNKAMSQYSAGTVYSDDSMSMPKEDAAAFLLASTAVASQAPHQLLFPGVPGNEYLAPGLSVPLGHQRHPPMAYPPGSSGSSIIDNSYPPQSSINGSEMDLENNLEYGTGDDVNSANNYYHHASYNGYLAEP